MAPGQSWTCLTCWKNRWKSCYSPAAGLLAPLYLGLSLALIVLGIKFFQEAFHVLSQVTSLIEADLVLTVLAMIDLVLVGSLIVMVMFSGYENFLSQMDIKEGGEKLAWLGKLDAGSLKLKVAASIVAISSIHLLRVFVNVEKIDNNDHLYWYTIIHLTFVLSAPQRRIVASLIV